MDEPGLGPFMGKGCRRNGSRRGDFPRGNGLPRILKHDHQFMGGIGKGVVLVEMKMLAVRGVLGKGDEDGGHLQEAARIAGDDNGVVVSI